MKCYVVIGFDARNHIVTSKGFEDLMKQMIIFMIYMPR